MSDYYETDDRSYVARHSDDLVSGLVQIRNGLRDILGLKATLEFVPPDDWQFAEQARERSEARRAVTELLLGEVAAALEAAKTGSVEKVQEQINHLKQIQHVEEAFPNQESGQQG